MPSQSFIQIISKSTVFPATKSTMPDLKLSVSDLPMLSCHYIQKGNLFSRPPISISELLFHLKRGLSRVLTNFPPLAGRLITDSDGYVYITCNDSGVEFVHANAGHLSIHDVTSPTHVPDSVKAFFDRTVSYDGHFKPILAVQVTELKDGVFVGFSVNHAVVDGTSLWNFINSFAEQMNDEKVTALIGSLLRNAVVLKTEPEPVPEISSFQSLCALLWRAVTRARKFPTSKTTTFRMAVNCRHRLKPEFETFYFGNAIQSIPTYATAGDVLSRDLKWCAEQLNKNVCSHDDEMVCRFVKKWESDPRCFPLGNFDGAMLTMGSSPWFPMFDNDFGWGKPVAVRSGRANKFDGKISAFPGREGGGSVDLEVVLSPETMAGIESDRSSCNIFVEYLFRTVL
ncbi:hypothetical protein L1987_42538 [Smallanthus sonchifolius]|uniref:Uncharacterized protein n=1 Tax=Smallanthus sonchifolius TaxID=185202 RepID=A0ACB9GKA2_9ASTR|nr:hypothetical protein L1987_42538 [Smallanthus sonchifolius]